MIFLKRFFDFIFFGNVYVALGSVCLIQSTIIQSGFNNHLIWYSLLTFFATLFVYNFQRVFYKPQHDNSLHSIRRKWIFKNGLTIRILSVIGFVGISITFFYNDFDVLFYLSPLLFLSIAYFAPFIKFRKNAWLKLLTLVFVWTMTTAVVPMLLSNSEMFTKNNLLHILIRSCFMLGICIPFDIRDLQIDKVDTISTIPHVLGENKAKWLAFSILVIYCLLIVIGYEYTLFKTEIFIALMISAAINMILVLISNSNRNEYFFVAGIDGTMILQGVLLAIMKFIYPST